MKTGTFKEAAGTDDQKPHHLYFSSPDFQHFFFSGLIHRPLKIQRRQHPKNMTLAALDTVRKSFTKCYVWKQLRGV